MNKKYFFMLLLVIMKASANALDVNTLDGSCRSLNEMFTQLNAMEFHTKDLSLSREKHKLIEAILLTTRSCNILMQKTTDRSGSDLYRIQLEADTITLIKKLENKLNNFKKIPHAITKAPIKYSQNPEVNNACEKVEYMLKALPEMGSTQDKDITELRDTLLTGLQACNQSKSVYHAMEMEPHLAQAAKEYVESGDESIIKGTKAISQVFDAIHSKFKK